MLMMILPMPTASATALPDMPEKMSEDTTFTCPSPPRNQPTMALAKSTRRSEMPPARMMFPAKT